MRQVKGGIRRCIYLLLVLCLCFSQAISVKAASAQTEDTRTVRVAFPIQEGMSYVRADGTVDVISNVSLSSIQGTRIIEKFAPRAYYFASSSKNEQLLEQLDETISIIGQVQPSLQDVLFDKFFRNTRYIFSPTDSQKE